MKAIVAEIDKKQMLVITDKGDFVKVKRQMSATIGDVVEITVQKTFVAYRRLASIAACFLMAIFLSTGVYAYYTPYSYVSVDINPSMAMSLNRFERVLSVEPLTEDAVSFIENTKNLKNREIDEALAEIMKSASEKGYIDEEAENQIMLVVSAKNPKQEEELAGKVNAVAARELGKVNGISEVTVAKTSVENYKTALEKKVSPGREILENKLREINPEIKDEELKDMSVKDVAKRIKEARKAEKALEKNNNAAEREQDKDEHLQSREHNNKYKETDNEDEDKNSNGKNEQQAVTGKGNKLKPAAVEKNNKDKNSSQNKNGTVESDKNKNNGNENNNSADKDSDDEDDQDSDDNDDSHKGNANVKDKDKSKDTGSENKEAK